MKLAKLVEREACSVQRAMAGMQLVQLHFWQAITLGGSRELSCQLMLAQPRQLGSACQRARVLMVERSCTPENPHVEVDFSGQHVCKAEGIQNPPAPQSFLEGVGVTIMNVLLASA